MVDFAVRGNSSRLKITIGGASGKQTELGKALQECVEGRCTCPTSQYEKLQSVDIAHDSNNVYVTLSAKAGEAIDREAIDKCLEYTAQQVGGEGK
jgi:hypothetical protein